MTLWASLLGFQLNFLALLLTAGGPWEPAACLLAAVWIAWQLAHRNMTRSVALLAGLTLVVGPLADIVLASTQRVSYGNYWYDGGIPLWIIMLWGCFGLGLRRPFGWLLSEKHFYCWPAVALGAPMAYLAGARLGAAELREPLVVTLCAISASWIFVFAVLKITARHLNRAAAFTPQDSDS